MHHPMMRPAEAEHLQLMVGIADEVAVREKQQLDDIPAQIALPKVRRPRLGGARIGGGVGVRELYVSHIDVPWFECYKTISRGEILDRFVGGDVSKRLETSKRR